MTDYYFHAIKEGEKAFKDGLPKTANPYLYDSVGANKAGWDRGWDDGKGQSKRKYKLKSK